MFSPYKLPRLDIGKVLSFLNYTYLSYLKVKLSKLAIGKVLLEPETQVATPSEIGNPQGRIGHIIKT